MCHGMLISACSPIGFVLFRINKQLSGVASCIYMLNIWSYLSAQCFVPLAGDVLHFSVIPGICIWDHPSEECPFNVTNRACILTVFVGACNNSFSLDGSIIISNQTDTHVKISPRMRILMKCSKLRVRVCVETTLRFVKTCLTEMVSNRRRGVFSYHYVKTRTIS